MGGTIGPSAALTPRESLLSTLKNYRTRFLFYCGKLDLMPMTITH
jgi:hypothetical protein